MFGVGKFESMPEERFRMDTFFGRAVTSSFFIDLASRWNAGLLSVCPAFECQALDTATEEVT